MSYLIKTVTKAELSLCGRMNFACKTILPVTTNFNLKTFTFADKIVALDRIWIIGDEFASSSYKQNFDRLNEENSYTKANFDVKSVISSQYSNNIRSLVGRIRNNVVVAVNEFVNLPKFIVMTLENDLIQATLMIDDDELEGAFNKIMNWLMNEIRKILMTQNEYLPKRSRRAVSVMWILPTEHENYKYKWRRELLATSMARIAKLHANNRALELKQLWNKSDAALYLREQERFTSEGYAVYWRAVDRTIKFFDYILTKNEEKKAIQAANLFAKSNKIEEQQDRRPLPRPRSRERSNSRDRKFASKRDAFDQNRTYRAENSYERDNNFIKQEYSQYKWRKNQQNRRSDYY